MIIPHLILCFLWIRSQIYCFWHNVSVPWLNLFLYGLKDDLCQKSSHPLSLSLSHHHSLNEEAWGSVTSLLPCQSLTCTGPPAASPVFTSGPQHGAKEHNHWGPRRSSDLYYLQGASRRSWCVSENGPQHGAQHLHHRRLLWLCEQTFEIML